MHREASTIKPKMTSWINLQKVSNSNTIFYEQFLFLAHFWQIETVDVVENKTNIKLLISPKANTKFYKSVNMDHKLFGFGI